MTKIKYIPCKCIQRGHCHVPGTRGHLYATTQGKNYPLQNCRYCK